MAKNSGSGGMVVCEVPDDVLKQLKAFKFRKAQNSAALILKVDAQKMVIVEDESLEDMTIEELQEALPTHEPRYVLLSYVYKHSDGRTSYPYCMIFISPSGCKPEMQMMYAGSMNNLVQLAQVTKVFEVRSTDELDEDWLNEKLSFFR